MRKNLILITKRGHNLKRLEETKFFNRRKKKENRNGNRTLKILKSRRCFKTKDLWPSFRGWMAVKCYILLGRPRETSRVRCLFSLLKAKKWCFEWFRTCIESIVFFPTMLIKIIDNNKSKPYGSIAPESNEQRRRGHSIGKFISLKIWEKCVCKTQLYSKQTSQ